MALRKSIDIEVDKTLSSDGVVFVESKEFLALPDCYIKVESVKGTKEKVCASVSITSTNNSYNKEYYFTPSMNEANFIKQAYDHLKTLDSYVGATDC